MTLRFSVEKWGAGQRVDVSKPTVCRSGSVWDAAPGDMKKTPHGESWEGEAWRVLGDGPRSGRRSTCGGFQLPTLMELLLIIL